MHDCRNDSEWHRPSSFHPSKRQPLEFGCLLLQPLGSVGKSESVTSECDTLVLGPCWLRVPFVFDDSGYHRFQGTRSTPAVPSNDIVKGLGAFSMGEWLLSHDSEGFSTGEHQWHHVLSELQPQLPGLSFDVEPARSGKLPHALKNAVMAPDNASSTYRVIMRVLPFSRPSCRQDDALEMSA
jgi:hypothetical protein